MSREARWHLDLAPFFACISNHQLPWSEVFIGIPWKPEMKLRPGAGQHVLGKATSSDLLANLLTQIELSNVASFRASGREQSI